MQRIIMPEGCEGIQVGVTTEGGRVSMWVRVGLNVAIVNSTMVDLIDSSIQAARRELIDGDEDLDADDYDPPALTRQEGC